MQFYDATTRAIWLSAAQTLHFEQCWLELPDGEPYWCPEWLRSDYAAKRQHWDPAELTVAEVPLSAFRAARALVDRTLALSWNTPGSCLVTPLSFEGIMWAHRDPDLFGYKLAMQAMGHGLGLFDLYPDPPDLLVPEVLYYGPTWEIDERFL